MSPFPNGLHSGFRKLAQSADIDPIDSLLMLCHWLSFIFSGFEKKELLPILWTVCGLFVLWLCSFF